MLLSNLFTIEEFYLFALFALIIFLFLIIDLGFFNKNPHKISTKSGLYQSIFWVIISVSFGFLIYKYNGGADASLEYFSAYLTEYALSIDNIFVILLILRYFKVKDIYYHKILFWGILGALVFRGVFIFLGAILIAKFHWILYILGALLVYSGIKIFYEDEADEIHPEKNIIFKFCRKHLRLIKDDYGGNFIITRNKKLYFTPLFLVIVLIETTDLIFAIDSIPAAFTITQNDFLIYTSNIFAVLGLRAKFFLLTGIIEKFYLLQKGLSFILIFIGVKMLLEIFGFIISIELSFAFIILTLTLSIIGSVIFNKKEEGQEAKENATS